MSLDSILKLIKKSGFLLKLWLYFRDSEEIYTVKTVELSFTDKNIDKSQHFL